MGILPQVKSANKLGEMPPIAASAGGQRTEATIDNLLIRDK